MKGPKMPATFETPGEGNDIYYITCQGLTGEGSASASVTATEFAPSSEYTLLNMVDKYSEQLHDASTYTVESYAALLVALNKATDVLADSSASADDQAAVLESLETAAKGLKKYVNKVFSVDSVDAATEMIAFEWYPGCPDVRNCTEMEFYSSDENRVLSLKTSNNGHIGYVVGNYPSDNSYLIGDGFHSYEGSKAVDLGLTNEAWYNVKLVFHFDTNKADIIITPRDNASLEGATVTGIDISADNNTITKLNYLLKRGRTDGDAANDLSILWDTYMDDFAYVYTTEANQVDQAAFEAEKEAFEAAVAGLNQATLAEEPFQIAFAVVDIMKKDVGFFTQADYDYATTVLKNATAIAPDKTNTTSVTVDAEKTTLAAGLSETLTAVLSENANEQIIWSSSDDSIATVVGNDTEAYVTAKGAGTNYVSAATNKEYAAVSAQVWSELPEGSIREEDTVTHENTSAFALDVPNGNYTMSLTFTNPTRAAMDVVVRAEDITRYDYGDHATSQIAEANIGAEQKKEETSTGYAYHLTMMLYW